MPPWPLADIIALSLLKGITASDIIRLVESHHDLEDALASLDADASLFGTPCEALREIANDALERAARCGVRVLTWRDDDMPCRVRGVAWPPALLWLRGSLPAETIPTVAVVGTRSCTMQYGVPVTQSFVATWADAGCAIVSGLASGIDTVAHEATLKHHGITIAVIASGIDRITPLHARRLADRIVERGGAIVSEYRCGQAALPPFFPQRNRIISALSDAVVVMESDRKGGSLITAEFARLQGRRLYAVPGPVTSTRSSGTNALLRDGHARAACEPQTVLDDLGLHRLPLDVSPPPLTDLDIVILRAIEGGEVHVDEVAQRCNMSVGVVWGTLLDMELRGLVRQLPGGRVAVMISV